MSGHELGVTCEIEPRLKPGRRLDPALVVAASRRGAMEFRTIEGLTKGLEIPLPPGYEFYDKDGHRRDKVRVRWWDASATTYREAGIPEPGAHKELPPTTIPGNAMLGYYDKKPVFFRPLLADRDSAAASTKGCLCGLLRWQGWRIGGLPMGWGAGVERARLCQRVRQ